MSIENPYDWSVGFWPPCAGGVPVGLPPNVRAAVENYISVGSLEAYEVLILSIHGAAADALPYRGLGSAGWLSTDQLVELTLHALWPYPERLDNSTREWLISFLEGRTAAALRRLCAEKYLEEEEITEIDVTAIEIYEDGVLRFKLLPHLPRHRQREVESLIEPIKRLDESNVDKYSPEHAEIRNKRFVLKSRVRFLTSKGRRELKRLFPKKGKLVRKTFGGKDEEQSEIPLDSRIAKSVPMTCAEYGARFSKDASWAYRQYKKGAGFKLTPGSKTIFWYQSWIDAWERRNATVVGQ